MIWCLHVPYKMSRASWWNAAALADAGANVLDAGPDFSIRLARGTHSGLAHHDYAKARMFCMFCGLCPQTRC